MPTLPIQISCDTSDAKIYYTLDGSEPSSNSNLYMKQFEVDTPYNRKEDESYELEDKWVKVVGVKEGYKDSDVLELRIPPKFRSLTAKVYDVDRPEITSVIPYLMFEIEINPDINSNISYESDFLKNVKAYISFDDQEYLEAYKLPSNTFKDYITEELTDQFNIDYIYSDIWRIYLQYRDASLINTFVKIKFECNGFIGFQEIGGTIQRLSEEITT